jgi:uncharacterized protein (TIGR02452 family)
MLLRDLHHCLLILLPISSYANPPHPLSFNKPPSTHLLTLVEKDPYHSDPLVHVYRVTKKTAFKGYSTSKGRVFPNLLSQAKKCKELTTLHNHPAKLVPLTEQRLFTAFEIVNQDAIDAALFIEQQGRNPCVLNLANAFSPGGGVEHGSKAQEEDLFRRSNYYVSLYPLFNKNLKAQIRLYQATKEGIAMEKCRPNGHKEYLVPEFGGIYSPNVCVFRESSAHHFAFMNEPVCLSFIAAAAYNRKTNHLPPSPSHGNSDYGPVSKASYVSNTKEKIRCILRIAAIHGHQDLVLGAFGCGAFQNDPNLIASLYAQIFNEPEFKNRFRHIVFAILSKNGPNSNYDIFCNNAEIQLLREQ